MEDAAEVLPNRSTRRHLARSRHEYGHGIGGLGDEYSGAGAYTGGPITSGNCSTVFDRNTIFWRRFISPNTPLPTTFGAGMDSNRTVARLKDAERKTQVSTGPFSIAECVRTPRTIARLLHHHEEVLIHLSRTQFLRCHLGDFDGDGKADVLIHNGQDSRFIATNPTTHSLDLVWNANNIVPAAPGGITWQPATHDQYFVGDFDGDGKDDVYVFNGVDWIIPYLGLLRSGGTGLQGVARYDGSIPGFWQMTAGDKFFVGDFMEITKPTSTFSMAPTGPFLTWECCAPTARLCPVSLATMGRFQAGS